MSALLPRLQHAWRTLASNPQAAARRLYVDELVYDAATSHRLIEVFGASQVMVGADYPFDIMDADPMAGSARSACLKWWPRRWPKAMHLGGWVEDEATGARSALPTPGQVQARMAAAAPP